MRFVAVFLLLQMLLQSLGSLKVHVAFALNKDYISAELCEQKDVLDNDCQGSCYLKKNLEKEQESTPAPVPEESLFTVGFYQELHPLSYEKSGFQTFSNWQVVHHANCQDGYLNAPFHPPLG
ncbi:MAG: hypothetical protein EP332_08945 [Bacteroidetes bacterium]|nr:MAG: hypothetical protein EP332_08945 [Bacteroidota bacterium]